jgi:type II secretory pathway component PulF
MTTWRYRAIGDGGIVRGERSGETAAEIRSALHAAGLRVVDLKPLRAHRRRTASPGSSEDASVSSLVHRVLDQRLRSGRSGKKAELLDGLATMLEAGVPLVEAVDSMGESGEDATTGFGDRRSNRMLRELCTSLRGGDSLAATMRQHPGWFDAAEAAMIEAGQRSGELPSVIRTISERHARSGELTNRLAAALAYPTIVALVGIGVVIFLSTKTLPELTTVLTEADQEVPALTAGVMAFGRGLLAVIPWLLIGAVLVVPMAILWVSFAKRLGVRGIGVPARMIPLVMRRAAVAEFLLGLTELLRTGVPAVEALRVIAPTTGGFVTGGLRKQVSAAADRLERGESMEDVLSDRHWFPSEVERLIRIGQHSGELESVLGRLGERYRRSARRLIDRLASLLEPAVVLVLAVGVGIVVMAAILPLIRLQQML